MVSKTHTEGLILTNWGAGDKDAGVSVLTRDRGVVRCFVKGAVSMKNSIFAAVQPLSYSKLSIWHGRHERIDEAVLIRTFFSAGTDLETMALIQYFSELILKTVPENISSSDQLDLMLNCLHLLNKKRKSLTLVKAVFETRLTSVSGHQPNLLYCDKCGKYEDELMYFDPSGNRLICQDCRKEETGLCPLGKGALTAFRYIVFAEPKKIFSFQISEESLCQLALCTESYALHFCDARLHTLEYYHSLLSMQKAAENN